MWNVTRLVAVVCLVLGAWVEAWPSESSDGPSAESEPAPASSESTLETIIVTSDRHETDSNESGRATSAVTMQRMEEISSRSTPEILDTHPGVFVQKTNHGGGQPIIRGRYGNQILLLYDGIRINNSIFRGGNNQYLNTVGPFLLERIEVLRGPASVEFGSDAIGGTVNVLPQDPFFGWNSEQIAGLVGLRVQVGTVDNEVTSQLFLKGRADRFAGQLAISYSDFGDLKSGGNVGIQPYTGYQQSSYDSQLAVQLTEDQEFKLVYSGIRQINVPRTDVFTPTDQFFYDEQFRDLVYGKYRAIRLGKTDLEIDAAMSFQSHREKWRRARLDRDVEERQWIEVSTLGGWTQLLLPLGVSHLIVCGADVYHDWVSSGRTDWSLDGELETSVRGKLAPRAKYTLIGLYLRDEWSLTDDLLIRAGGRFTGYVARVPKEEVVGRIESQAVGLVSSLSVLWRLTRLFNLNVGVHQGFRAPNIYDLTATGRFAGGWDVANPDLKPEQVLTGELGFKVNHRQFRGSIFYYYTYLDGLIARAPWTLNGSSTFEGLEVFHRDNISSAALQGIELSAQYAINPNLLLFLNATWTEGNDLSAENAPLPRVPPLNGTLGFRWQGLDDIWFFELYSRFALKQDRLAVQDVSDVRIPPGGTPEFITLHARGGIRWGQSLNWTIQAVNLTNQEYRYHGSGIDQSGFGVRTSLEYRL